MQTSTKSIIHVTCLILFLVFSEHPSFSEMIIPAQTSPQDAIIQEQFQPGSGLPVGKIQSVRGDVVITHRDPALRYRVKTGLPLYQGDTIIVQENGRILGRLIDGSQFALTPLTTLTILYSNFNSTRKTSVSLLSLKRGGARFRVKGSVELSSYEFKVQTETAFVVTKHADFIVKARAESTEIIALNESRLDVTGMADPEEVTFLSNFQQVVFAKEWQPPAVENIPQEEANAMTAEFRLLPLSNVFASSAEKYHLND